ncbi:bifunctional adenosylcobinamide kinase/adenosylcobinamide-phosphate guanylyltransferase [Paratractidigestivibacter sp.]|uniref:bifunctional adenosylcobinamide kinase/adenosylcobinamide-phosphate guanylyltransferase n=1 Tax=Paratractidigestivibacter sp. TaxID=2847316 RepID=UPI002ABE7C47|nr:bifunctional adenosylcobinamide kinase/adenosylcobinamide-phosphate guanylyltransferase [Paratractidigestivibacter sp.]
MKILVTGGSSSGKSAFAEKVACSLSKPHIYFATMQPFGEDGERRIARHRELRRERDFLTVECYGGYEALDLAAAAGVSVSDGTLLVECVGNVVANVQFGSGEKGETLPETVGELADAVFSGIEALSLQCANAVVVANEIGSDGISYPCETNVYMRALGAVNCRLAACFDVVYEVVVGCPVALKRPEGTFAWEL